MNYEYGVVIRRQRRGQPAVWQFWIGEGCHYENASFLATMNWAGARGFEAFAAGNFDEIGVPEVILKRSVALPPPPPVPAPTGKAGAELARPSSPVRRKSDAKAEAPVEPKPKAKLPAKPAVKKPKGAS